MKRAYRDNKNRIFHIVIGEGPDPGPDQTQFLVVAQSKEEALSNIRASDKKYRFDWVVLRCEEVKFPGFTVTIEPTELNEVMELKRGFKEEIDNEQQYNDNHKK